MPNVNTSEFRSGLKLMIDGDPCSIIENEFVKPGKGQAFVRTRFRNLKSGRVIERTFRSGESVESADVLEMPLQYIYNDGDLCGWEAISWTSRHSSSTRHPLGPTPSPVTQFAAR